MTTPRITLTRNEQSWLEYHRSTCPETVAFREKFGVHPEVLLADLEATAVTILDRDGSRIEFEVQATDSRGIDHVVRGEWWSGSCQVYHLDGLQVCPTYWGGIVHDAVAAIDPDLLRPEVRTPAELMASEDRRIRRAYEREEINAEFEAGIGLPWSPQRNGQC